MHKQELINQITTKKSLLCVGLDPELSKLPPHLPQNEQGVFQFCKEIIQSTLPYCVSYKFNIAFFEVLGGRGLDILAELRTLVPKTHLSIVDAKRGDIGNTAKQYAKAFFETMNFDAITLSPYMGLDSITPFLEYQNKWSIILGLTSNQGSEDFELLDYRGQPFCFEVMKRCAEIGDSNQTMFVVGATQSDFMKSIRDLLPNYFFLVPGVGSQGGSLQDVCTYLTNQGVGALINSSRSIIYASSDENFASASAQEAKKIQQEMELYF